MIESPFTPAKCDRLSAFFKAFDFSVHPVAPAAPHGDAKLVVLAGPHRQPLQLVFYARGQATRESEDDVLVAVSISFGGPANPLVTALPDRLTLTLDESSTLRAIADAFVEETLDTRCGRDAALSRLCEVIVLMILRNAIDAGTTAPGLLAGLSHPALHRALVAMHDAPARAWRIDDLASLAGMSRSRFMALFRDTVGTTPGAYLTGWRLMLARRALEEGGRVKPTALRVGFGSAAAFSRAYSRQFGHAPVAARRH